MIDRDIFEDLFVLEMANNHRGDVKRGLKIISVKTLDEVLEHALAASLTPIEWEDEPAGQAVIPATGEERSGLVTH